MSKRPYTFKNGFTLTELSIAMVFAIIIILGTISFSYYSRLDTDKSNLHNVSVGLAELILNDWRASGGSNTYDPVNSFTNYFPIAPTDAGSNRLDNLLGSYMIMLDDNDYRITLSYRNSTDESPKVLNVVVDWVEKSNDWDGSDPRGFVKLSGYVTEY